MKHWFSDLYSSIDAMRLDDFAAGLAPDVEVVVGNNPPMRGRQAVKEGIGHFWSSIQGLKHNFVNVAESQGLTFLEAKVDYLRKDGKREQFWPGTHRKHQSHQQILGSCSPLSMSRTREAPI